MFGPRDSCARLKTGGEVSLSSAVSGLESRIKVYSRRERGRREKRVWKKEGGLRQRRFMQEGGKETGKARQTREGSVIVSVDP